MDDLVVKACRPVNDVKQSDSALILIGKVGCWLANKAANYRRKISQRIIFFALPCLSEGDSSNGKIENFSILWAKFPLFPPL